MSVAMIRKEKITKSFRCLIHGMEGVGKTTFAACAPKPVFILTEDGMGQVQADHFPLCGSYGEVMTCLQSLAYEDHDYKTVVIDSIDWLERLATRQICQDLGIEALLDIPYGGGTCKLIPRFDEVIAALDLLRSKKGMNIVLIAHTKTEKVEDPRGSSYDQYSPRLDKRVNGTVKEWADVIGFATQTIRKEETDEGFGRKRTTAKTVKTSDGSDRVLILEPSPAIVAKNRYNLPAEIPLDGRKFFITLWNKIHGKQ